MSSSSESPLEPALGLTTEDLIEVLKESADEVFSTMLGMAGVLVEQHVAGEPAPERDATWDNRPSVAQSVLDPAGEFKLGTPRIGQYLEQHHEVNLGGLVYRLAKGCTSVEVWMDGSTAA